MEDDSREAGAGRRGRRASPPDAYSGPVGEFAHRLWELKQSAGDPSYARIRSQYGALASRSALAAAARGQRLPSWDTTWEFVRPLAVGVLEQPEDRTRRMWHARWSRARLAAGQQSVLDVSGEHPRVAAASGGPVDRGPVPARTGGPGRGVPAVAAAPADPPVADEDAAPLRGAWWSPFRLVLAAAAVVVAGASVVALSLGNRVDAPAGRHTPAVPGDAAEFVADVSVPDGTRIRPGDEVVKTWELRNVGGVVWDGRYLRRTESVGSPTVCTTLTDRVPIAHTEPGGLTCTDIVSSTVDIVRTETLSPVRAAPA